MSDVKLQDDEAPTAFEKPQAGRMITSMVLLETIALIAICLLAGTYLYGVLTDFFTSMQWKFQIRRSCVCCLSGLS